ncbi:zinc metallopeptidase [Nitratireductor pacificus]|uniref:Peptidase membrane zinc metallopeptidase n=1 Tax=Nitratireductor pacificus pht-3B TaxID=391937 RepID=K2LH82_9HYPH|nr:zinc metallopeptidase [Nitratireductor pacificus]EKF17109.1 peptidase membrane zinc metallopeptidase [Nitratireductor pacificus pht-3B]
MLIALAGLALLAAIVLPQLLVRLTFSRHAADRPDIPGTGGELARHLLDSFGLGHVRVEVTDRGDHYDPRDKAVRLGERNLNGRSLTAVAVAAHEVSHALQDDRGERSFTLWQRLAALAAQTDRIAGLFFIAAPILAIFARTPMALIALVLVGVALLAVRVVVTLVTLPIEFDASFGKALPILEEGNYVARADLPAVRSVLRAAALTYLAAALISLVNLARWVRLLR